VNPVSAIYGFATATRNRLYDRGILRVQKLSRPVISVGNISAGGSGKTPFVMLLVELLKQRGIACDVLSRGYGRKTRGVLAVNPNGSPEQFGDEPLLIAKNTKINCPVIVGENRYQAGVFAEKSYASSLHILDDGFQHRSLHRDFDIVLLTPEDLRDSLLPAGRLREPLSSLRRADAIVLTGELDISKLPAGKAMWRIHRSLIIPTNISLQKPIVFCGIARPRNFVDQLRHAGINPATEKFFPDHHRYTDRDINELLKLRDHHSADSFIATQKDAANLGNRVAELAPIAFAPVKMELISPADALDTMLRVIGERRAQP
jgi:tetraacyldisaccharide 4'-kinase